MIEIKSLTIDELKSALKEMGEKPLRAGEMFRWLGAFSGKFSADRTGSRPQAGEPR